jgi:hypothetical protein
MTTFTSEVPADQIRLEAIGPGPGWQIIQRDRPIERFDSFDIALTAAAVIFRERRAEGVHILVRPAASPFAL